MLHLQFTTEQDPSVAAYPLLVKDTTGTYDPITNPNGYGEPDTAGVELAGVLAAEYVYASGSSGETVNVLAYDPMLAESFRLAVPHDGIIRVLFAAIVVVELDTLPEEYPAAGVAYYDLERKASFVRGTGTPDTDAVLSLNLLLGEGEGDVIPQVQSWTAGYHFTDLVLQDALARLNLRYLSVPVPELSPLVDLYERAELLQKGAGRLFAINRYLDAAAVLQGAHRLLISGGQTPDDFAPLVSALPSPSYA